MRSLVIAAAAAVCTARIHHLSISNDPRFAFSIEDFGFLPGGAVNMTIHDIQPSPADSTAHLLGFILWPTKTESIISEAVDDLIINRHCALDADPAQAYVINMSDPSQWGSEKQEIQLTVLGSGLYDLVFTHCSPLPGSGVSVSFKIDYVFANPGSSEGEWNYLSVGEMPLPIVFGVMTVMFAGAAVAWFINLRRRRSDVHKIHHLMSLLIVLKVLSVLFESVMYHYIAVTGHSTGWNVVFYILTFMRGLLLVAVIALVGAGWSLLKPFLNDREKKVFAIILPLQVLNNIAIIVVDEMDPGSMAFAAWVNVLHVADVLASIALLFPVVWSIKHLRAAQESDRGDEKARNTLLRLTQFRSFYITTIAYLYFTRIIVYLMLATLPYDRQWLSQFFDEIATLLYYVVAGYRFRPAVENTEYLRVPTADDDEGTGIGDVELTGTGNASSSTSGVGPVTLDDDQTDARATSASVRVVAPSQTITRSTGVIGRGEVSQTTAGSSVARAAASGNDDGDEDGDLAGPTTTAKGGATAITVAPAGSAAGEKGASSSSASASAQAAGATSNKPATKVAIADDDEEDEFGLDDDDDAAFSQVGLKSGIKSAGNNGTGSSGGRASGGLRNVKAGMKDGDDDDDL